MVKSTEGIIEEMRRISEDTEYNGETILEIMKIKRIQKKREKQQFCFLGAGHGFQRIADALEGIESKLKRR